MQTNQENKAIKLAKPHYQKYFSVDMQCFWSHYSWKKKILSFSYNFVLTDLYFIIPFHV